MSSGEINNSYELRSPMAPQLIFPEEELAVTTPRYHPKQIRQGKGGDEGRADEVAGDEGGRSGGADRHG